MWSLSKVTLEHICTGVTVRKRSISATRVMSASTVASSFVPVGQGGFGAQAHSDTKQFMAMSRETDGLLLNYGMAKKLVTTLAGDPTAVLMR